IAMPPKGGALDADDIDVIARWIAQGAAFEGEGDGTHWHWAYRPPVRANPPPVRDTMWPRTPVDQFVLARLEREGLQPSAPADLATLARRVALDLTGLPPTLERLDALLADDRPDAYERYVDELLDSPHYGEHWARMWMDLGRYADTHGYEKDGRRTMWPWRDWVIDAFNRDLPFDRFSIEQLAGDLLPSPTLEQVVATGFNRNTQINEEGGTNPEEFRIDAVIDRVNTVASVWLGSTIACAQCHDHKFDPFTQRAYFQMVALFNQDDPDVVSGLLETTAAGGTAPWGPPAGRAVLEQLWSEREAIARELDKGDAIGAAQSTWESSMAGRPQLAWKPLRPERVTGPDRVQFIVAEDGLVSLAGANPPTAVYTFDTVVEPSTIAAIRLDLPLPPSPYRPAVGRSGNGNIVLTGLELSVVSGASDGDDASTAPVGFARASADFEQPGEFGGGGSWPVAAALDDDPSTGWAVGPRTGREHTAWFVLDTPLVLDQPTRLRVVLRQEWGSEHRLARFRLLSSAVAPPPTLHPLPAPVEAALAKAEAERTPADRLALDTHFRDVSPLAASIRARLAAATKAVSEAATATAMVMRSNPLPRETHVHRRGNYRNPGERVEPGVPEVLALREAPGPTNRLEFAEWLFAPGHPLTGRVAANRLWERLFGQGLVRTSEDFGTQGDPPTYPELLDWLATEYPRRGWSQKSMLRLLVRSAAYRQASIVTPELLERDPENRLLARGPRFRVEAETIRDIALSASGLLAPAIGGPSVFPPQPPGVWTMIYSNDQWVNSEGADRYRRGLYTFARRTAPYPTFTAFDAPSREIACPRRSRTNTPLQALVALNDPQFVEAAAALSHRLIALAGADDRDRIIDGFRRCTSRSPEEEEVATLSELLDREREHYRTASGQAEALTGLSGDAAVEAAAMQAVASVLLNLDETMSKE
ncbi:MAG: DUF1553 domain-containing protein, partial [Phycisphaerales bacterium]|nr:DUF1553 domain-containing protein [Phycisphaerales bacterium]